MGIGDAISAPSTPGPQGKSSGVCRFWHTLSPPPTVLPLPSRAGGTLLLLEDPDRLVALRGSRPPLRCFVFAVLRWRGGHEFAQKTAHDLGDLADRAVEGSLVGSGRRRGPGDLAHELQGGVVAFSSVAAGSRLFNGTMFRHIPARYARSQVDGRAGTGARPGPRPTHRGGMVRAEGPRYARGYRNRRR